MGFLPAYHTKVVSIPTGAIKGSMLGPRPTNATSVSIPTGAIKGSNCLIGCRSMGMFQFQQVRLKAARWRQAGCGSNVSIPTGAIKGELKEIAFVRHACVSIPTGAIKGSGKSNLMEL